MAAATRERALEASVDLLGTQGVRALSHARVEDRAGLPAGSTSNWFRTRRALLAGVVDWIAERERADFAAASVPAVTGPDDLAEGLIRMIETESGPFASRTRARYALFLELAGDAELLGPLRRQRQEFERWTERIVTDAGIPDPAPATRALMALAEGLLLHRLTVDQALDIRPLMTRAVHGLAR